MDQVPPITLEEFASAMMWAPWNIYCRPAFNEAVFTPQEIMEFARDEFGAWLEITVH